MTERIRTYLRRHHVALLALFLAIGGTSYAAVKLPTNSVATKQIKNGQVKRADLGNDAITSPKVKDGSLQARDFAFGQLPAGPRGPGGPAGDPGKPGADGAPATKLFAVSDESGNVLASSGLASHGQIFVKTGVYVAQFDRDVSKCAPEATSTGGAPTFISTTLVAPTEIRVEAFLGDLPGHHVSQGFSLAVFC